jgi:mannose-6-phosphate isomerase-like protein (cupin superfamily)
MCKSYNYFFKKDMLIKKEEAQEFSIPGGTEGVLYPSSPSGDQTIAYVEIDGVYPEKGYSINDVCTESIFLVAGSVEVELDGKWNVLEEGDVCLIFPGNKYRMRGNGKALDLITPAWDKNQNHIIIE